MSEVTRILASIDDDPQAVDALLPLVYQELRKLAADKLANEQPGQTIQATVLVHEVWLRLVGPDVDMQWNGRGHFSGPLRKPCSAFWLRTLDARKASKRVGVVSPRHGFMLRFVACC